MTCKRALGFATMFVVGLAHGCSSSDGGAIAQPVDGGSFDSGARADASVSDGGIAPDASSSCAPGDVSTFQPAPYQGATGAYQGKCSAAQISAYYDVCLAANTTAATCAPFAGSGASSANKACASCIVTADTATKLGPVVEHTGVLTINTPGCMELLDPTGGLTCAKAYQAFDECDRAACAANCAVTDDASFALYQACVDQASSNGCSAFSQGLTCAGAEADSGAAAACFNGKSFEDLYNAVVPIFCGASLIDAGGAD